VCDINHKPEHQKSNSNHMDNVSSERINWSRCWARRPWAQANKKITLFRGCPQWSDCCGISGNQWIPDWWISVTDRYSSSLEYYDF